VIRSVAGRGTSRSFDYCSDWWVYLETVMSYALFEDEEKLTRSFPTRQEVWNAAERAGLIVPGPDGKMALEDHFEIKPCEPDPNEVSIDPGPDFIFS
jgi:hypothetical protein